MSCRQVFCYRGPETTAGGLIEGPALYGHQNSWSAPTLNAARRTVFRWDGEIGNLVVRLTAAPGVGKSFTYTFVKNGTPTALSVTIADAATDGRSTSFISIASGDTGYWQRSFTGVLPADHIPKLTFEFVHADDYISGYSGLFDGLSSTPARIAPLSPHRDQAFNVIPTPGDLTALDYVLQTAPGSGKSRLLTLYKNAVAQDGSGGTPDTRVTIADLATTGSWSGTVSLAAGDYIDVRDVATSSPANSVVSISATFAADTDGESIVPGLAIPAGPTPRYYAPSAQCSGAGDDDTTETNMEVLGGVSSFVLSNWYGRWSATGYGVFVDPHAYETRLNNATPGSPLNLAFDDPALTDADTTDSMTVADGDVWSSSITAGWSNFAAVYLSWSYAQFAIGEPVQIIGSHVIGADGTVDTSRTGLINLDGVTRTVSGSGVEFIGGSIGMIEQATAPAGIANTALIYAIDSGAGKTKLMAQFGTGSAIQLAVEP
jgi:hypothetical protein